MSTDRGPDASSPGGNFRKRERANVFMVDLNQSPSKNPASPATREPLRSKSVDLSSTRSRCRQHISARFQVPSANSRQAEKYWRAAYWTREIAAREKRKRAFRQHVCAPPGSLRLHTSASRCGLHRRCRPKETIHQQRKRWGSDCHSLFATLYTLVSLLPESTPNNRVSERSPPYNPTRNAGADVLNHWITV